MVSFKEGRNVGTQEQFNFWDSRVLVRELLRYQGGQIQLRRELVLVVLHVPMPLEIRVVDEPK